MSLFVLQIYIIMTAPFVWKFGKNKRSVFKKEFCWLTQVSFISTVIIPVLNFSVSRETITATVNCFLIPPPPWLKIFSLGLRLHQTMVNECKGSPYGRHFLSGNLLALCVRMTGSTKSILPHTKSEEDETRC